MCLTNTLMTMTETLPLIKNTDDILHVIYDYTSTGDDELTLK